MEILKFITHSKRVVSIAIKNGWYPGARYTNLRDIRTFEFAGNGFLDIDWENYSFAKHLEVVAATKPKLTIARDIESIFQIDTILRQAEKLREYALIVAVVPKDPQMTGRLEGLIPADFVLAYSVPTKYGGTRIPTSSFTRPVHLLGGRPDVQRQLADKMNVISFDCNRFTYDARFGDYFDGELFRPHPDGGYTRCLMDSIRNINSLWRDYKIASETRELLLEVKA